MKNLRRTDGRTDGGTDDERKVMVNSFREQSLTKTLPANSRTGQKHYTLRNFVAWGL
jgi:hypothetical protein